MQNTLKQHHIIGIMRHIRCKVFTINSIGMDAFLLF